MKLRQTSQQQQRKMNSSAEDARRATKNNMISDQKRLILDELLKLSKGEILHVTVKAVAEDYSLDRRQISNIWNRYKDSKKEGAPVYLTSGKKCRSGRKRISIYEHYISEQPNMYYIFEQRQYQAIHKATLSEKSALKQLGVAYMFPVSQFYSFKRSLRHLGDCSFKKINCTVIPYPQEPKKVQAGKRLIPKETCVLAPSEQRYQHADSNLI